MIIYNIVLDNRARLVHHLSTYKIPKPSQRQNPCRFILHMETNDLKSEKSSEAIVKEIMNTAVSHKSEAHNVRVSNIIVRTDNQELTLKAIEVSNYLANLRRSIFVWLIIRNEWNRIILTTAGFTRTKKSKRFLEMCIAKKLSKWHTFSNSGFGRRKQFYWFAPGR